MKRFFGILAFALLASVIAVPLIAFSSPAETLTVRNTGGFGFDVTANFADGDTQLRHILGGRTASWQATLENPIVGIEALKDPIECFVHHTVKNPISGSWELVSDSRKCQLRAALNRRH